MVSDTQVYRVGNSTSVTLQVSYGDGQPGGTSTVWNGGIVDVPPGQAVTFHRGGAPLGGTILFCKSNVLDESRDTNRTSVTYHLSGGEAYQDFPYAQTVPNQGDLAEYAVNFVFV